MVAEYMRADGQPLGSNVGALSYCTIGEAAFSLVMRELYESYLDYRPSATEEQVYRTFL